jgi:ABC-2 type transport system ATP-binding protein
MSSILIEAHHLQRNFRRSVKDPGLSGVIKNLFHRKYVEKVAVKNLNFKIPEGSFMGLVGSNGAGKTTLLKMCSGLLHPSSGSLKVLDYTPSERKSDFLRSIGLVMGQKSQLWSDISARDSLELFGAIYDIPRAEFKRRLDEMLTLFNLTKLVGVQVRRLSLGERMKFELIAALIHKPRLLLLDEPTIGLDLIAKEAVRKFLTKDLSKEKVSVILSSHDMEDIQEVCDDLMIIAKGEMKYFGSTKDFGKADEKFKTGVLKLISEDEVPEKPEGES